MEHQTSDTRDVKSAEMITTGPVKDFEGGRSQGEPSEELSCNSGEWQNHQE